MKLHSIFLRNGCILPNRLDPLQESIGNEWTIVKDLGAPVFDTMIRQAGSHFIWVHGSSARRGVGKTRQSATAHALTHALKGVAQRFNAAELNSVEFAKYPGFYIAHVAVQPRQLQQDSSLEPRDEGPRR
ncbi:MAG TPA: hypothetical protein VHD85_02850 [Terracidiphilus sp.]|nr:hypothetical protein [Terracidiphilus sp.]